MGLVRDKRVKDALMNSTVQAMFERGELRKDHPLQRKPGRWNDSDKSGLIASVLKDEDIDSIKVCEQLMANGVILWVIDGLQRLTTFDAYYHNSFKIGQSVEFPMVTYQAVKKDPEGNLIKDDYGNYEYELVEYDLRGKYYTDLPVELKEKFNNYKIDIVKHLDCTDEEIGYHIRRYNKQKSMNGSENAVTYMDNIAKEVKRVSSNNKFFKNDAYKELERNNGTIERIITESVMCMFHMDNWKKQSKKMGEYLNENSSKEEFDKLNNNLNRLDAIYNIEFEKIFTAKNSFIWFTLFDKFTYLGLPDNKFAEFIKSFIEDKLSEKEIAGETFDKIDRNKSTKDKYVISKKIEILECLMRNFLKAGVDEHKDIDIETFVAEVLDMDKKEVLNDMDFYEESLNKLEEDTIKDGSKLLNQENRPSLLAMMVYSYQCDRDLDEWMEYYAQRNNTYFVDQTKNFLHMKDDFESYLENKDRKSA